MMKRSSLRAAIALLFLLGCGSSPPARLTYRTVTSRTMHQTRMTYAVYTPHDFRAGERLPLVVFLHGGGDSHESFDEWGIGQRLDRALAEGRLPRVVIVVPQGHLGFWANWVDGSRNYEDWVLYEVMPAVVRTYHTQPCPDGCHLMGVSMGGAGTLRIALRHPNRFVSAGIISAPVMSTSEMLEFVDNRFFNIFIPTHRIWGRPSRETVESEDPFLRWTDAGSTPRIFLAWAREDRSIIISGSQRLDAHLSEAGVPHASEEFDGGHNWVSWGPVIERAIAHAVDR